MLLEYNLKYLLLIGNVFHSQDVDAAIEKGELYDPETDIYASDIDPAYGSPSFGIVIPSLYKINYKFYMKKNTKDLTSVKRWKRYGIQYNTLVPPSVVYFFN